MSPADIGVAARWPAAPYKGLTYYTDADAMLFAGRDDDIIRCGTLLAEWKMRLLLLHGATGCGKSSFLRAGLIPHLESASSGIAFARTGAFGDTRSCSSGRLPIRSAASPTRSTRSPIARSRGRRPTDSSRCACATRCRHAWPGAARTRLPSSDDCAGKIPTRCSASSSSSARWSRRRWC